MHASLLVIFIGLLIFVSHLFTGIFERKGIPDVLLLMIIGIIIGPIFGMVSPDSFGIVTGIFTTITLVFIMFHGGLDLKMDAMRASLKTMMSLTAVSFVGTAVTVGLVSWLFIGLEPLPAFIFAFILSGTSEAVVIPMVKQLKVAENSKTVLVLEAAMSAVLSIVLVLALIQAYSSGGIRIGALAGGIISSFILAAILGVGSALFWSMILVKVRTIKNSMFTTPAFLFVIYGLAEELGFAGPIAALAFGVTLANIDLFHFKFLSKIRSEGLETFNQVEKQFFSEIVFLLKTFFFVLIGLSIQFSNAWAMILGFLITLIIFVVRIPVVKFAVGPTVSTLDKTIMATMVPKGLASAVLANLPLQAGMPGGELIRDLTYAVILTSIVLTSVMIPLLTKFRGVAGFYGAIFNSNGPLPELGALTEQSAEVERLEGAEGEGEKLGDDI